MFSHTLLLPLLAACSMLVTANPISPAPPQSNPNPTTPGPLYIVTSAHIHQYAGPVASGPKIQARDATSPPVPTYYASLPSPPASSGVSGNNPRTPTMEDFNITILRGNNPGYRVQCNVTWDAGTANAHTVDLPLQCNDAQARVKLQRLNVTPVYGFYVFVQMPDTPEATWMVKDVPHSPGWTYNGGDGDFKGAANLTQLATQSLDDYIRT